MILKLKKTKFIKKIIVFFNRRLSAAVKLKIIKYTEERSIHAASNYNRVLRLTIRYWIKGNVELMKIT